MANQYEIFLNETDLTFKVYKGDNDNRYAITKFYKSELEDAIEMVQSFGTCTLQIWYNVSDYDMFYFN